MKNIARTRNSPTLVRNLRNAAVTAIMLIVTAAAAGARPAMPITDQSVRQWVVDQLSSDQAVRHDAISVEVNDGTVILTGSVASPFNERRAASIARTVRGVTSVDDRLVVDANVQLGNEVLRSSVESALADVPLSSSERIDVSVTDGNVRLSGQVRDWQHRQLADQAVGRLIGVRSVDDQLTLARQTAANDDAVESALRNRLAWDGLIDASATSFDVNNATVTLRGTVGSAAERMRAIDDAHDVGAVRVDAAGLRVAGWDRAAAFRDDKFDVREDGEIQAAVERALCSDAWAGGQDIHVAVANGEVTLTGTTAMLKAARMARQVARTVTNVAGVESRVSVQVNSHVSDETLSARAIAAIRRDAALEGTGVSVVVSGNEARLIGSVASQFQKSVADDDVSRVKGIVAVDNRIGVEHSSDPLVYNPWVDTFMPYDYTWWTDYRPASHSGVSDDALKTRIVDGFANSPFVEDNAVTVTVRDGAAFLNGRVQSWTERWVAEQDAFNAGARLVYNNVKVK